MQCDERNHTFPCCSQKIYKVGLSFPAEGLFI